LLALRQLSDVMLCMAQVKRIVKNRYPLGVSSLVKKTVSTVCKILFKDRVKILQKSVINLF